MNRAYSSHDQLTVHEEFSRAYLQLCSPMLTAASTDASLEELRGQLSAPLQTFQRSTYRFLIVGRAVFFREYFHLRAVQGYAQAARAINETHGTEADRSLHPGSSGSPYDSSFGSAEKDQQQ